MEAFLFVGSPKYHIVIIAPSGRVDKEQLEKGIQLIISKGHTVELGKHIYEENGPFAGSDSQRLEDLQWAMDHQRADIIWMARGGYGLTRIIDQTSFDRLVERPKLIIGFSDITALFLDERLSDFTVCHGPMVQHLNNRQIDVLESILTKKGQRFKSESTTSQIDLETIITGGNLSLIVNCLGISSPDQFNGKTLLIEEIAEYDYKIDRMLVQLLRSGIIRNLDAIMLGAFTETTVGRFPMKDVFESLEAEARRFDIPIIQGLQIGHIEENLPLLLNTKTNLNYNQGILNLSYHKLPVFD